MTVAAATALFTAPVTAPNTVTAPITELRPRRLPAPATEPPFDEHPPARAAVVLPTQAVQGTLALDFTLSSGVLARPRATLRLVPDPAPEEPSFPAAGLPPVDEWSHTVAVAIAQILSGERSASQFLHWASPEVLARLGRRAALAASLGGPRRRAVLRAVHICRPALGVVEVSTVVHGLLRPRALAFRLEARRSRWVCTALDIG